MRNIKRGTKEEKLDEEHQKRNKRGKIRLGT